MDEREMARLLAMGRMGVVAVRAALVSCPRSGRTTSKRRISSVLFCPFSAALLCPFRLRSTMWFPCWPVKSIMNS